MIISLALAVLAMAGGTVATYLYEERTAFAPRLCTGTCIGLAALGLVGFTLASLLGLAPLSILLTVFLLSTPAVFVWKNPGRRKLLQSQLALTSHSVRRSLIHPTRAQWGYVGFYLLTAVVLWKVFSRAMIELPEGIYTGALNNFGDLPFHLSVITGFAFGNNFPPEDPTYAGVRFTYPFLTDFVSAIFVRSGASLRDSIFIENFLLAMAFVGLLHRWAWEMLRNRLAAIITPLLVLLNGGLGWTLLWNQARANEKGLFGALENLAPSYTVIPQTTWRWGNAISSLLLPQRGILLGLPLAVIVFTQWWLTLRETDEASERKNLPEGNEAAKVGRNARKKGIGASDAPTLSPIHRMFAAGVVAGLLPLVHAHSFVVVMVVGAALALLQPRWREWFAFFSVALVIALPQMYWSTHGSAVEAQNFFAWQFGWDRGQESALWFWFKNSGLFIPLTVAAILWRHKEQYLVPRQLLLFFLPFTLCFIAPNVVKLAPWIWDNIKVLFYWWLASAPLVAMLLAKLWQQGKWNRVLAAALFVCLTLAGSLDVAAIALRNSKFQVFDKDGLEFAEVIKERTAPRALIMHAPVHNTPVFLTGRRSLMGYPGHIWTHGLEFSQREAEIKRMYAGAPEAMQLIGNYKIEYVVVGKQERDAMSVNDKLFTSMPKVGEVGDYRLYKTAP